MEDLCSLLQLKWDEKCIEWIRNAVDHCTEIMVDYKTPDSDLWSAMRSAFASENVYSEGFMPDFNLGPDIHPQDLRFGECTILLTNIARDYFTHWPQIQVIETLSIGLWMLLLVAIGVLSLFGLIFVAYVFKIKFDEMQIRESENALSKVATDDQELKAIDTTKTIIIKVSNKIGDGIGYAFRKHEPIDMYCTTMDCGDDSELELPYKRVFVEEILNFLENYPHKLRVILLFDDVKVYDDVCKYCVEKPPTDEKSPKLCSRSSSRSSVVTATITRSRIPVMFKANNGASKNGY